MSGTVLMGRRKNVPTDEVKPSVAAAGKLNAPCKMTTDFYDKLKLVADDFGQFPGELVQSHMGDWLQTEYERVLRKRLAAVEKEKAAKDRLVQWVNRAMS